MHPNPTKLKLYEPACYRICVQGVLDESWIDYFSGLAIACDPTTPHPVTTLTGQVVDQTMLVGVLNGLYDLGFCLLGVECLEDSNHPKHALDQS